ncbi:MAG: dihydrofolate reductase family protein [Verrucomicrobia bacterium]|nr:dihydrofolate reductase family protein [Verrucomicrobiota bacterium]
MKGVIHLRPLASRQTRLPFVLVNMAISADGKIATANRAVASFGSPRDLAHLYTLRATADAVMCGAGTVRDGAVTLDTGGARYRQLRLTRGLAPHHLRVIVSGSGHLDPELPIFGALSADRAGKAGVNPRTPSASRIREPVRSAQSARSAPGLPALSEFWPPGTCKTRRPPPESPPVPFSPAPLLILTTERAGASQCARLAAVADAVVVCGVREVNWPGALAHLRARWGVKRLVCEGGGELNDALFRAGLVHELHLTICPLLIGGRQAPTLADGVGFTRLIDAARFRLLRRRRVGDELFCVYTRRDPRG